MADYPTNTDVLEITHDHTGARAALALLQLCMAPRGNRRAVPDSDEVMDFINARLASHPYITGGKFTAADVLYASAFALFMPLERGQFAIALNRGHSLIPRVLSRTSCRLTTRDDGRCRSRDHLPDNLRLALLTRIPAVHPDTLTSEVERLVAGEEQDGLNDLLG